MHYRLLSFCAPFVVSLLLVAGCSAQGATGDPIPPDDKGAPGSLDPGSSGPSVPRPIPEGCWFDKIHIDFGSHVETAKEVRLKGTYVFKNATDKAQQIKAIVPSCECQHLEFFVNGDEVVLERKNDPEQSLKKPIEVPAGADGKLVMEFDIAGAAGVRTGEIRVDTTDPKMATLTLSCAAKVTPVYRVDPPIITLGMMSPTEQKRWSCKVYCNVRDDWKVVKAAPPLPDGLAVTSIDRKTAPGGKEVHYELHGTYGPELQEGAIGGNLVFTTDNPDQNFLVEIRAEVREKVKMTPLFFSFNSFPRDKAQQKTLYFWPAEPLLEENVIIVDRVEVQNCNFPKEFLSFEIVPPKKRAANDKLEFKKLTAQQIEVPLDKLWQVHVKLKEGVPGRIVRAKCLVHLKGDGMVPKPFQFNGFPRTPR